MKMLPNGVSRAEVVKIVFMHSMLRLFTYSSLLFFFPIPLNLQCATYDEEVYTARDLL